MQLRQYRTPFTLSLTLAFAAMTLTPSASAFPCGQELKKVISTTALIATLGCFVRLVTKKTQPKRVYPKDDSFSETGWYIFDELLTGQMEKGERPSKVTIDDPENPQELTIQYSKIEARGLAGILYSTMKPVIIPALTFMILFNKDFMEKAALGIYDMTKFINDPTKPFETFMELAKNGPPQPPVAKPANN
jgi:hypothetical protein